MREERSRRLLEGVFLTGLSVLALAVSAYATYWQRQQARAMVLPRLQLSTWLDEGRVALTLDNVGVGPADIKTVQVTLDGKPLKSWRDFLIATDMFKGVDKPHIYYASIRGRVIGAGRDVKVIEITEPRAAERVRTFLPRVVIDLCYCSVLEECWHLIEGESSRHDPVSSCRGLPNNFGD
jgi:hypothetical protein